jgi:hypothetical protein
MPGVKFTLSGFRSFKTKNQWPRKEEFLEYKAFFEKRGFHCWFETKLRPNLEKK